MEVVILAGGYGTRLRSVSDDLPKSMVPLDKQPFLAGLIKKLVPKGTKITLAVSYKRECILSYFGNRFHDCEISYSVEKKPLGTGGAIKQALLQCTEGNIVVLNGDSLLDFRIKNLLAKHEETKADISIALTKMVKPYRYGTVKMENNRIISFNEKKDIPEGIINCGIYCLNRNVLKNEDEFFSFEKYLEKNLKKNITLGHIYNGYFIDIGIPEDYSKAIKDSIFD